MAAPCVSCGDLLRFKTEMFQERLEYVMGNSKRLRTVPLRGPLCSRCVNRLATLARTSDWTPSASIAVVAALDAYLELAATSAGDKESDLEAWSKVLLAMDVFKQVGTQPELFEDAT